VQTEFIIPKRSVVQRPRALEPAGVIHTDDFYTIFDSYINIGKFVLTVSLHLLSFANLY